MGCCQTAVSYFDRENHNKRPIIILGFEANDTELIAAGCDLLLNIYEDDPYLFMFDALNMQLPKQEYERVLRDRCGNTFTELENLYIALSLFTYSRLHRLIVDCGLWDLVGKTIIVTSRIHNAIILEKLDNAL